MGRIEIEFRSGEPGETIRYIEPYLGIKSGKEKSEPSFFVLAGPIEVHIQFESQDSFRNFVNSLKADVLQVETAIIEPTTAKIEVYRKGENFLAGDYSYLEFLNHGEKSAFFISVNTKPNGSFDISFYFDIKEELQKVIDILEKTVKMRL